LSVTKVSPLRMIAHDEVREPTLNHAERELVRHGGQIHRFA
jgi:hypothetical protein